MADDTESIDLKYRSDTYFRSIFNRFDRDKDGYITINELNEMIESRQYEYRIPPCTIQKIHELHDINKDHKLDFEEFVDMLQDSDLDYIFGPYIKTYVMWIIPNPLYRSYTRVKGGYEEQYTCCPPAIGMLILSLVQTIFFFIDKSIRNAGINVQGPVAEVFTYEPQKRYEAWRYLSYMFVHVGSFHLMVNVLIQILLGIPLEMVHKWWRVLVIYFSGVLAGSLATSIVDPSVKLAGASGGVYSLITAHVASIIMNWKEMSYPAAHLLVFLVIAFTDTGTAIYNRYFLLEKRNISYVSHFAGALAGLVVGINVVRNLSVTKTERVIRYVSIVTYTTLLVMCIIWNAAWANYFPLSIHSRKNNQTKQ